MRSKRLIEEARSRGLHLFERYERTRDPQLLLQAAEEFRRSAEAAPDRDPRKSRDLAHLCTLLRAYYTERAELWALDEAIEAGRTSLAIERDERVRQTTTLQLGIALSSKFQDTGDEAALLNGIDVLTYVGGLPPAPDVVSVSGRYHLAQLLFLAYEHFQNLNYLSRATEVGRAAARTDDVSEIPALFNLIHHLQKLASVSADKAPLLESEQHARLAVERTRRGDAQDHARCVFLLARTLDLVWMQTQQSEYLQEAVSLADQSILSTSDRQERYLRGLVREAMVRRLQETTSHPQRGPGPPPPPLF